MSYKDLYTMTSPKSTLPPKATTATTLGAGVDRKFNESAIAVLHVGVRTDGTHTFKLQESDDNITFTDVGASQLQGAFPVLTDASTNNTAHHVGYLGIKRYIRAHVTVAGATTGAVYGVSIVQDYPRFSGASQLTP